MPFQGRLIVLSNLLFNSPLYYNVKRPTYYLQGSEYLELSAECTNEMNSQNLKFGRLVRFPHPILPRSGCVCVCVSIRFSLFLGGCCSSLLLLFRKSASSSFTIPPLLFSSADDVSPSLHRWDQIGEAIDLIFQVAVPV